MRRIDRKIEKYSYKLGILFLKARSGECRVKKAEALSRKLDKLIIKKNIFTQID
jgi:hypothetical protein